MRSWYATRVAARRRAEEIETEREERGFVEFLDSLFHASKSSHTNPPSDIRESSAPYYAESATQHAQAFSDSEAEEEEETDDVDANDKFLNALFEGFALQQSSASTDTEQSTIVPVAAGTETVPLPRDESPSYTAEPSAAASSPDSVPSSDLDDVRERYTANLLRVERLETLDTLSAKLDTLIADFSFPSTLDFEDVPFNDETIPSIPALTYTTANVSYHSHAQSLLKLLVDADAVESDGDEEVRRRRKGFVRMVEAELDALERRKGEVWKAQRV